MEMCRVLLYTELTSHEDPCALLKVPSMAAEHLKLKFPSSQSNRSKRF